MAPRNPDPAIPPGNQPLKVILGMAGFTLPPASPHCAPSDSFTTFAS